MRINPLFTLRESNRVLKPKGILLLSTPNITPAHRLRFFLYEQGYQGNRIDAFEKLERWGHMGHFRLYTLREIESLIKYLGKDHGKYGAK